MNGKCPNCTHSPKKGGSTTICDGCRAEVHLLCVGLSSDDVRVTRNKSRSIRILCNNCNQLMGELGEFKNILTSLKDDFNKKFASLEEKLVVSNQSDIGGLKKAIENLQKDIKDIKDNKVTCESENNMFEEVVQEITEREKRKRNLVLFGPTEQHQVAAEERILADKALIADILNTANIPTQNVNLKPIRLGKYTPGKNRPIKINLESEDHVHLVIKKARELKNMDRFKHISISLDRTPKQIDDYRNVKKIFDERKNNGETNIKIKYINGYPRIIHLNA